ncbi:MAG: hypothetical protein L3J61_06135 [Ghiorsea sp.]|nr:hypothetical protein [Ghiorsea sp.]
MYMLLAHGSSHANHAVQVKALAEQVSTLLGKPVGTAFLSDKTLPQEATVLPLFLGYGKHLSQDVPKLIQGANAKMLQPLVESSDALSSLIVQRLIKDSKRIHVLAVVYQFTGFEKLVAALYKQGKPCSMFAISALHGAPNISSVLTNLKEQGIKKVVLQPVLLFDGHSLELCKTKAEEVGIEVEIQPALTTLDGFAALVANIFE